MFEFRKTLSTQDGIMVFSFVRLYETKHDRYFVSATGKTVRHHFHMEEREGHWKIMPTPQVPAWLLQVEEQLNSIIQENQA